MRLYIVYSGTICYFVRSWVIVLLIVVTSATFGQTQANDSSTKPSDQLPKSVMDLLHAQVAMDTGFDRPAVLICAL